MVSSKLKIKQQNRNKLFYSKFKYRAELSGVGVRFVFNTKTLQKCLERIDTYNINTPYSNHRISLVPIDTKKVDGHLLEDLINFRLKYKDSKEVKIYRSGYGYDTYTVYTNDTNVLEEVRDISNTVNITEVITPPSEVMYFAKEPEYKYRVYLKTTRASSELISTLNSFRNSYHNKGDIWLSGGLVLFLMRHCNTHRSLYLPGASFIDFKDEQTLTLMHLLFGECLRKSCKLEKRPK